MSPHPPIHPGWLLVMPGGHLHSWLAHTSNHPDPQAAMGWFEPDSARRAVLIRQGWTVRVGAGTELIPAVAHRAPASA
jgi:hypothetical protein